MRQKDFKLKLCPVCETKFKRPSGKSNKVWEAQVCCGKSCSAINRRKKEIVGTNRRKDLVPGENRYAGWGANKTGEVGRTKYQVNIQ